MIYRRSRKKNPACRTNLLGCYPIASTIIESFSPDRTYTTEVHSAKCTRRLAAARRSPGRDVTLSAVCHVANRPSGLLSGESSSRDPGAQVRTRGHGIDRIFPSQRRKREPGSGWLAAASLGEEDTFRLRFPLNGFVLLAVSMTWLQLCRPQLATRGAEPRRNNVLLFLFFFAKAKQRAAGCYSVQFSFSCATKQNNTWLRQAYYSPTILSRMRLYLSTFQFLNEKCMHIRPTMSKFFFPMQSSRNIHTAKTSWIYITFWDFEKNQSSIFSDPKITSRYNLDEGLHFYFESEKLYTKKIILYTLWLSCSHVKKSIR